MLKRESFFRPMVILYTNRHIFIKPNDEKSSILYFIMSGYWHERGARLQKASFEIEIWQCSKNKRIRGL